jgi:hypothetical protein
MFLSSDKTGVRLRIQPLIWRSIRGEITKTGGVWFESPESPESPERSGGPFLNYFLQ